jgi:hypothetical protein
VGRYNGFVRITLALALVLAGCVTTLVRAQYLTPVDESGADGPFLRVDMDAGPGYIIPAAYAESHKAEIVASLPGHVLIEGFWNLTEQHTTVAERVFRQALQDGVKDPKTLFPDLSEEAVGDESIDSVRRMIQSVVDNYPHYTRQYIGVIIDGTKLVYCVYSDAPKLDPLTQYFDMEKYFVTGKTHFLFCRVDAHWKTWSNPAIIGSWLPEQRR